MKVIFNTVLPFSWTHGGAQIQIEQTQRALESAGVNVEPLRWWDPNQKGDILQNFGRLSSNLVRAAQASGMKVVMLDLMTSQGSRSRARLLAQRLGSRALEAVLPRVVTAYFSWESYRLADACLANTQWEKYLMSYLFGADPSRVHVLPNGVENVFFEAARPARDQWLVTTATITPRKRVLELAKAAAAAKVPVRFFGKPYDLKDPYFLEFTAFVRRNEPSLQYGGGIADRTELASIYGQAKGFVLLSTRETRSLAAEEAAAAKCPLLLTDLPWARSTFGSDASYCPIASTETTAAVLKRFYETVETAPLPPTPLTWPQVGLQLRGIYEKVLSTSR